VRRQWIWTAGKCSI